MGHRRENAGLADLHFDLEQPGQGLLGLILVGHHPARRLARVAQAALLIEIVDLDDHAVGFVGQIVAALGPAGDVLQHGVDAVELGDVRIDRQTIFLEMFQCLPLTLDGQALDHAEAVGEELEIPLGTLTGIEQFQRAGGGVPRVGEGLQALGGSRAVDAGQFLGGHVDLAARLEGARRLLRPQAQRQAANGLEIVRHVVAALAVAARRPDRESPLFVD